MFELFRAGFVGKVSPVHLFWGGARPRGHAVLRPHRAAAPGRRAELRAARHARGVLARGQQRRLLAGTRRRGHLLLLRLPGAARLPRPPGRPQGARWDDALAEFVLPYEIVRTASDPDATLLEFLRSTYVAAAETADWNRKDLER